MPPAKVVLTSKILFVLVSCATLTANAVILLREYKAVEKLEGIERHILTAVDEHVASGNQKEPAAVLRKLDAQSRETAKQLAAFRAAAPSLLLAKTADRLRQKSQRVASMTQSMVDLSMISDKPPTEATAQPRIIYANYDLIDEFLEMSSPPNTARNPATYTFTISYPGELFLETKLGEIKRGQVVGAFSLDAVKVETRRGPVVKDKIVRYQRERGGVRAPVWSYKRLPSRQVVVAELSALADRSRHKIFYPASEKGEQSRVRRELPIGWVEIWETEEECTSQFPVMVGSEFSWSGSDYSVEDVTPQELKLKTVASGESLNLLLGNGL
jgi:hypothetical protein